MADKRVTESRRVVTCELCGSQFQLRHLKDHTDRIHKGKKPTVRPAANQRTLQFSAPRQKRVSESEDNTNDNAKVARVEEPEEETDDVGLKVVIPEKPQVPDDVDVNPVTNEEIMKEIKLSTDMLMESMNELYKDKKKNAASGTLPVLRNKLG